MHADKGDTGQLFFQAFQRKHRNIFTFSGINSYIILHALDVENIIKEYLFVFAAALDKEIIFRLFSGITG
ncbi:MAG: hypothetical protein JWR09_2315 [Mucilaginibacter sp.]|nr:hypothetical protein [Mucilaginibacter sp.]